MGYLPNYANFSVSRVNFKCYTILVYFDGGTSMTSTSTGQNFTSTCHNNNTKALKCLGGAGAGGSFSNSTSSGNLTNYINTVVSAMQAQGYDGLDIDWEDGINNTQYANLVKGLKAAFAKITPKPLLTIATADYISSACIPVATYADQLNVMSYYDGASSIPSEVSSFTKGGVARSELGIGYGYDTDQEYDGPNEMGNGPNGNPADINAKCDSAASNGYGGIMVWEVDAAPKACDSVTALWVNKNATSVQPVAMGAAMMSREDNFAIVNNVATGGAEIKYSIPSAEVVNLNLFNMKGALVQNLSQGSREAGTYSVAISRGLVSPGAYILRMGTPVGNQAGIVIVK